MGKFTGIILVSDFDGTFFSGITEGYKRNLTEIERFKNDGGLFAFATGRDYYSLLELEPNAGKVANAPIITANGSRLYDTNKKEYIFNHTLNMKLFSEFLEIISKKYPDIGIRFSCESGIVVNASNDIIKQDFSDLFLPNSPISLREIPFQKLTDSGENVYKCVIGHVPEIVDDVRKIGESLENINREFLFTKSYPRGLEVVNSNASKGSMALKLKEYLNKKDNIEYKLFAIGDYDNDLDMINHADYGAAPANALEHVKKAAKIHTVSCRDGAVADLIRIIEKDYV
jgi:Cof subfamily protein (haloacid dehalogenase superfamily)